MVLPLAAALFPLDGEPAGAKAPFALRGGEEEEGG